jgi:hypothetical protein
MASLRCSGDAQHSELSRRRPDVAKALRGCVSKSGVATVYLPNLSLSDTDVQQLCQCLLHDPVRAAAAVALVLSSSSRGHRSNACSCLLGFRRQLHLDSNRRPAVLTHARRAGLSERGRLCWQALSEATVRMLDLRRNQLGDEGARALASLLRTRPSAICGLNVSKNRLQRPGLDDLLAAAAQHSTLTVLNVEGNPGSSELPQEALSALQVSGDRFCAGQVLDRDQNPSAADCVCPSSRFRASGSIRKYYTYSFTRYADHLPLEERASESTTAWYGGRARSGRYMLR